MFHTVMNTVAYQRYATQSLHNALIEKRKAVVVADNNRSEMFTTIIENIASDIISVKTTINTITKDVDINEYCKKIPKEAALVIAEMLADISRLEALCHRETARIKSHMVALALGKTTSRCAANSTPQ